MMTLQSIRMLWAEALMTRNHITFLAAKTAMLNYHRYGMLTPGDVEKLKQTWGVE